MQDLHEGWAALLAEEMNEQGLSNKELARRCGVSPSTITRVLSADICPTDELKWKICGALGKRPDELYPWPRIVPPKPETWIAA